MKLLLLFALTLLAETAFATYASDSSLQKVRRNYGPNYNISAMIPVGAVLDIDRDASKGWLSFDSRSKGKGSKKLKSLQLRIYCGNEQGAGSLLSRGSFDMAANRWVKDSHALYIDILASEDRRDIRNASRIILATEIYDIKSVNAQGWLDTYDGALVNKTSQGYMAFCVLNPPKAICGSGVVPRGRNIKKYARQVLKIVRSFEFLEDVAEPRQTKFNATADAVKQPTLMLSTRVNAGMAPGCMIEMVLPVGHDSRLRYSGDPAYGRGGFWVEAIRKSSVVSVGVAPLPRSWKSSEKSLGFALDCLEENDGQVTSGFALLNPETGMWGKNLTPSFLSESSAEERPKELNTVVSILNIKAVNTQGYVVVVEKSAGFKKRQRELSFCLFRSPKAVCGFTHFVMPREGSEGDLTQHAIDMIQSIEFVEDESEVDQSQAAEPSASLGETSAPLARPRKSSNAIPMF